MLQSFTSLKFFYKFEVICSSFNYLYILKLENISNNVIRYIELCINDSFYYQHHTFDLISNILS